jgi:hypothetical protein
MIFGRVAVLTKSLVIIVLCLQLTISPLRTSGALILVLGSGEVEANWDFEIEVSGKTEVHLSATSIAQFEITFHVPKTCQDLKITPALNSTIKPLDGHSFDELNINCRNVDRLNLSYVWPDGAVQFDGSYYFAGQEKPHVGPGNVAVQLPTNSSVFWIEGFSDFAGNVTDRLTFKIDAIQPIPSFGYSFHDLPQPEVATRTSEHVTLNYHPTMEGKPWIDSTVEIIEEQWSWLKTILNGTLNHVSITFAPYGYKDLGTKKAGFCSFGDRNIEVAATNQFGVGFDGADTAIVLHELTHALTPLLEDLPAFYSEAIAQDFAYDALRRTELNASADSCEETWFNYAYEYGVKQGLFNHIWVWHWDDTIYDNSKIAWACYGTVAFIGDYITHNWGHAFYRKLNDIFDETEINGLPGDERRAKFIEYMNEACSCDISEAFDVLPYLIARWFDAYKLRNEYRDYKIEMTGPFTEYAQPTIDEMILNASNEYNSRNFEVSAQKFRQIREYVEELERLDASYWTEQAKLWRTIAILEVVLFAILLAFVVFSCHRKSRQLRTTRTQTGKIVLSIIHEKTPFDP